jgi:Carbohydrate-binding family 9
LPASPAEVVAGRLERSIKANAFPDEDDWRLSEPVRFCHDWRGNHPDPQRSTEVKVLWSLDELYLRFLCRYRTLHVFADSGPNGRRDELWNRDVAEVFLQSERFGEKYYKEFEVSPNGQWLDLDITPQGLGQIASNMRSNVSLDEANRVWIADLAIPIAALTQKFDPQEAWRVNFFRCEGVDPQRFYSAWQPTNTPEPNFHVPQKFGTLRFQR